MVFSRANPRDFVYAESFEVVLSFVRPGSHLQGRAPRSFRGRNV
jgi:hypothetical protein